MKNKVKIALLGGDLRHYTAAVHLCKDPWEVFLWGMDLAKKEESSLIFCKTYQEAIEGAAAVILPLPTSVDGYTLNSPLNAEGESLKLRELLEVMDASTLLVGGRIPHEFSILANTKGVKTVDFFEREDFQIRNAYTTAEAALSIAMNSMTREIRGAKIAVTGYGRISKCLVDLLLGMGADVTVAARKDADLSFAEIKGAHPLKIDETQQSAGMQSLMHGFDVVYNTVPCWLFDRHFLENVDKNTFLIDLASAPGGVDICAAKELNSNVLWATSLPGKYAPLSAGQWIASCVDRILSGEVACV